MLHRLVPLFFLLSACGPEDALVDPTVSDRLSYTSPQRIRLLDYTDDVMEPFLTQDGQMLFFNNLNVPTVNTNLHYAGRVNDTTFHYLGEVPGANTNALEGVPSMDTAGNLYFISTRSYDQTLSTLYKGVFQQDTLTEVQLISGVSREQAGWVNFDAEVSPDGHQLYLVDGRFDADGGPYTADIVLAEQMAGNFRRRADQSLLDEINTDALEYAPAITADGRALYFTRVEAPLTPSSIPKILVATRASTSKPFGTPQVISSDTVFAEAPTLSADGCTVYYHQKEGNRFVLYRMQKIP